MRLNPTVTITGFRIVAVLMWRRTTRSMTAPNRPAKSKVNTNATANGIWKTVRSVKATNVLNIAVSPWAKVMTLVVLKIRTMPKAVSAYRLPSARPFTISCPHGRSSVTPSASE